MPLFKRDRTLTINAVDLSAYCIGLEMTTSRSTQDATTTSSANRIYAVGLPDYALVVEFEQDRGAGTVDATLEPLTLEGGGPVTVAATSGGTDSVSYSASMHLTSYVPIAGGDPDEIERFSATFVPAGAMTIT